MPFVPCPPWVEESRRQWAETREWRETYRAEFQAKSDREKAEFIQARLEEWRNGTLHPDFMKDNYFINGERSDSVIEARGAIWQEIYKKMNEDRKQERRDQRKLEKEKQQKSEFGAFTPLPSDFLLADDPIYQEQCVLSALQNTVDYLCSTGNTDPYADFSLSRL